jgi:hypothetical protein
MTRALLIAPALLCGAAMLASAQEQVIPRGTEIRVRTDEYINSHHAEPGRIYPADIARPVYDRDGHVAIPQGARAYLVVRDVGHSELVLDLESIRVHGRRYVLDTSSEALYGGHREGVGENGRTGKFVGGGALLGTIVGAIAGGGKGAAIGAVSGAAAGAGAEMATRGRVVRVPAESILTFRLDHHLRLGPRDDFYQHDGGYYRH